MNLKERVKYLIDKALEENPSLFLIEYSIGKGNLIKVIIDGDNGVNIDDCVILSRAIEHNLDREEEDFSLEVSSCGIFAPLTQERQYIKNIGREVEVETTETKYIGVIKEVHEGKVSLEVTSRQPKANGKGKTTITETIVLPINNIKETKFRTVFSSRGENVSGCFIISAINGSNTNQRQYGSRGIKNRPIRSKAKRGAIDNWELVKRFHFGCGQAGH